MTNFASGDSIAPLLVSLRVGSASGRIAAARALGQLGGARAVPALVVALGDVDVDVRGAAAGALLQIEDPAIAPALRAVFRDYNIHARWGAAWVLGRIGAPAVPPLVEILKQTDHLGPCGIVKALEYIARNDPTPALRAALPLLRRLKDRDPLNTADCQEALALIETVTASMRDLPVTAMASPVGQNLPVMAAAPNDDSPE